MAVTATILYMRQSLGQYCCAIEISFFERAYHLSIGELPAARRFAEEQGAAMAPRLGGDTADMQFEMIDGGP